MLIRPADPGRDSAACAAIYAPFVLDTAVSFEDTPPDAAEDIRKDITDKALELGMKQIDDRGYAEQYIGSGKTIYKAAFVFFGRDNVEMLACIIAAQ